MAAYVLEEPSVSTGAGWCGAGTGGAWTAVVMALSTCRGWAAGREEEGR